MRIAISGATGFIGSHLSTYLKGLGNDVTGLGREWFQKENEGQLISALAETDVVINLAGAPINRRWTPEYKKILYDSRIVTTHRLVNAINRSERVQLFISTSAVGYYPSSGCYDESYTGKGDGFLAGLCDAWETEAKRVKQAVRLAITRFGVVLAPDGGAFVQLVRSARLGIGTIVASGNQPFTWISLTDLMKAMNFIICHPELKGIFNFVAPEQITYADFIHVLTQHYHSLASVKVPAIFFRMLYGEGADFLLQGQCVLPARLKEAGFRFDVPAVSVFIR